MKYKKVIKNFKYRYVRINLPDKLKLFLVIGLLLLSLSYLIGSLFFVNIANANPLINDNGINFLGGLYDGFFIVFAFIFSLFSDNVNIYEVNNNGVGYNFGYLLGLFAIFAAMFDW